LAFHHIENLYLQDDCWPLSEIETAGQSEVDLLCPRPVESNPANGLGLLALMPRAEFGVLCSTAF
jgi:hypothetical protein